MSMGVYIDGMKMPKENDYTIAIVYGDGVVTEYHEDYWIRGEDGEKQIGTAVPIPPHGRLIDADALHEELYALEYDRENEWLDGVREARGVDAARVSLLDAPTIIPAEEEV